MNTRKEKRGDPQATAKAERAEARGSAHGTAEEESTDSMEGERRSESNRLAELIDLPLACLREATSVSFPVSAPSENCRRLSGSALPACRVSPNHAAPLEEKSEAEAPQMGEAAQPMRDSRKEGAGPTDDTVRVSVPSDERREGPALIAVHMERIFIDPLTRKPLTLDELRRALCGDGE